MERGCCRGGTAPEIKIGVLTNQTGVDGHGKRTVDVLAAVPGVKLAAIFSPEHGIFGSADTTAIGNTTDPATGVPVYSLYGAGDAKRPLLLRQAHLAYMRIYYRCAPKADVEPSGPGS